MTPSKLFNDIKMHNYVMQVQTCYIGRSKEEFKEMFKGLGTMEGK